MVDSFQRRRAKADLLGGPLAPRLRGVVRLYEVPNGVDVYTYVTGLPPYQPAGPRGEPIGPHGFHIHEFGDCTVGDPRDPFQGAGKHWDPDDQPHGNHAGDFPVLFSNNGIARMRFFTNRFRIAQPIGRSVIIHENPNDYRTQPDGNAGRRLACGIIRWEN